jgi:hypothetical protein
MRAVLLVSDEQSGSQLSQSGHIATLRLVFAFSGLNEFY